MLHCRDVYSKCFFGFRRKSCLNFAYSPNKLLDRIYLDTWSRGLQQMWMTFFIILFIGYSILGWTLFFLQPSFLYRPVGEVQYDPGDINLTFERVVLKTSDDVKLAGWYIPAENGRYTILMCHANGGNMSYYLDTVNIFSEMGMNCLIFDYRGYGQSQGKPTEKGTYLDAKAGWNWLTKKKNIAPENIIIFGRSLGASIASHLAMGTNPQTLVLESAFTSYADIGKKFYPYLPVKPFAKFKYNTLEHISKVDCPTLFIHSRNDEMIPFEFSLRLYDAAKEPKELVEIYGCHNDGFLFSGDTYRQGWQRWIEFLNERSSQSKSRFRSP